MDEQKDDKIRSLFDGYAEELEPQPRLAEKAREKIKSRRSNKRVGIIVCTSVAGFAAAAAVCVFAVGVLRNANNFGGSNDLSPSGPSTEIENCISYSVSQVRAVRADPDVAEKVFRLDAIRSETDVFSENYYVCYMKDSDEFVYVKGVFGVATDDGTTEINVIAEKRGYRRDDLEQNYETLIEHGGGDINYQKAVGEYITLAYRTDSEMHYYVTARGGSLDTYDIAYKIANAL